MILTSPLKRIALAAAAAAATVWIGAATPAAAQYYSHPAYRQAAGQPAYVPPRVLRKQREMQKRVIKKYGYPPPAYGYRGPVYRQPPGYGYGRPDYRYRQPGYGYRQPGYGYREPVRRYDW